MAVMRNWIPTGAAVAAVFLAMLSPLLLVPGEGARIDEFLSLRTRVLSTLHAGSMPPAGVTRSVQRTTPAWDPSFPGDARLKQTIRAAGWWRQSSEQAMFTLAEALVDARRADSLAESLLKHETKGLGKAGLRPLTSGRADSGHDPHSASVFQVWSDTDHHLTVITQVTVSGAAREACVSKHLVEQFPQAP